MDLPNDIPGPDAHCRVSVARCKPCTNPYDTSDLPRYLPAGLTQFVLNNYTTTPPFHVTADDVSVPVERLEVDKISSHRSVRGRGGVIAVLYQTNWKGLLRPILGTRIGPPSLSPTHPRILGRCAPAAYGRRTGCTAVCAWVPSNVNSPATRAPVSCLTDTATSITKRGLAGSVAPSCLSAPTSGKRVKIIFGGSEKIPCTLQLPDTL